MLIRQQPDLHKQVLPNISIFILFHSPLLKQKALTAYYRKQGASWSTNEKEQRRPAASLEEKGRICFIFIILEIFLNFMVAGWEMFCVEVQRKKTTTHSSSSSFSSFFFYSSFWLFWLKCRHNKPIHRVAKGFTLLQTGGRLGWFCCWGCNKMVVECLDHRPCPSISPEPTDVF